MIENIKRIVNEHRTLKVVIIGVLVICFIYWWFCCKDSVPKNKVRGGFESGLYYAYDANDIGVGRVALYKTVYVPHPDVFIVIHRLLEHIKTDENNNTLDKILGIFNMHPPIRICLMMLNNYQNQLDSLERGLLIMVIRL